MFAAAGAAFLISLAFGVSPLAASFPFVGLPVDERAEEVVFVVAGSQLECIAAFTKFSFPRRSRCSLISADYNLGLSSSLFRVVGFLGSMQFVIFLDPLKKLQIILVFTLDKFCDINMLVKVSFVKPEPFQFYAY